MTITEFLLARIAEDEAMARRATRGPWVSSGGSVDGARHQPVVMGGWDSAGSLQDACTVEDASQIARHDPTRVLAECEAKRRIVELHGACPTPQEMIYGTITACEECGSVDDSPVEWPCPTLRALASVYADHPDFDPAWRA